MRFSDTENNMTFCIGVCWLGTPNMESLQKIMMNLNIIDNLNSNRQCNSVEFIVS